MGRYDYGHYDTDSFLLYEDIEDEYPREEISFKSGNNNLSAYLYGEENEKGIIVIAPGHTDANDIKLYEMRFFVDAGYSVIGFDYTGYYTSEGNALGGYTQAVYDLDALLSHIEKHSFFADKSIYLFGHSMGGYAVAAVLGMGHEVKAVVTASGFDTPEEQWQYSISKYTGIVYPLVRPFNSLFINLKYKNNKNLSAIDGINSVNIPILIISAEDDSFYGGKSPIYNKKENIINKSCTFILMDKENHNGHYDYFLTDAALNYQASKPKKDIDKELYMEHDVKVMQTIIDFYNNSK